MSFSFQIINALSDLKYKCVETQTDLIVRLLSELHVPVAEEESVMKQCADFCVLSNSVRHMQNVSWGDVAVRADEAKTNRFVHIPVAEWERTKIMAKGDRWNSPWFASWDEWKEWADRINGKRRAEHSPPREVPRLVIAREPDRIKQLLEDRLDVIRYPQRHVTSEAEKFALIRDYEVIIVRRGGKARLDAVKEAEWATATALPPNLPAYRQIACLCSE